MKLNIAERFALLPILPEQGNYATMKAIHEARMALAPDDAEWEFYGIRQVHDEQGDRIAWDPQTADEAKDIPIGRVAAGAIQEKLKEMENSGKLTLSHVSIYEKFVEYPALALVGGSDESDQSPESEP
jgi:hypothetical protein